jgi:hypothetical protein
MADLKGSNPNRMFSETLQYCAKVGSAETMFEREVVPLDVFLYDKSQLGLDVKLSPKQFDVVAHASQIYRIDLLLSLKLPIYRPVNRVIVQVGKGGGKDFIIGLTFARIIDLLDCMRIPQSYFDMSTTSNIDLINMALNAPQAKFNFFEPMRRVICKSSRFKNMVDDHEKYLLFPKNIYAHSGHSDEDSTEGKNLIAAALDEVGAFKTKQETSSVSQRLRAPKYSYEALVDAMESSIETRFDTGKLIAMSFPRYKGDPIQQMYNAGLEDNKRNGDKSKTYVAFGATWDFNPNKKKENFEEALRRNPTLVKAKYMCEPSQAEDAYIKNVEIIDNTFPDVAEDKVIHTLGDYPRLKSWVKCNHNFACSAHIDLGLNHCRAGIALTHQFDAKVEKVINPDNGQECILELPLVAVDLVTSFQAPPDSEIDFSEIRLFLFALRLAGFHIGVVSYDQWNSAGERQILEKAGFNMVKRSVDCDRSMYDDMMIMAGEGRLVGGYASYRNYSINGQTVKLCIIKEELQGLVEVRGKKILPRPNGTNDEADALAGSVRGAIEFGVWRFGESSLTAEKADSKQRAMEQDASESKVVEKIKAMTGNNTNIPDNVIYRGVPTGR